MVKKSLLSRLPTSDLGFSRIQSQVDSLAGGFAEQAADCRSLAAMMAGGAAYRLGRMGVLSSRVGVQNFEPLRCAASIGLGLTAEVSVFELTHRGLSTHPENSNLWSWNGTGGLRQGLLQSFITFGTLKGAGRFAQSENLILQHLAQDTAMVAGHQISGSLNIAPRPIGTLAEQFLHAEATNLQIGAGMALAHRLTPGVHALERGLDLSSQSSVGANLVFARNAGGDGRIQDSPLHEVLQPAFAALGRTFVDVAPRPVPEENAKPAPLLMSAHRLETAFEKIPPPEIVLNGARVQEITKRLDLLFRLYSDKDFSARESLPLLFPYPPGYRLKALGFSVKSDGSLVLQGEVEKIGSFVTAEFERLLFREVDRTRPTLFVLGQGLKVHPPRQGIGSALVLNEMAFYRALGASTVVIPVGEQGGLFWPKLGFDFPSDSAREKMLSSFRKFLIRENFAVDGISQSALDRIEHSWDLLRFEDAEGRPAGETFLSSYPNTWTSQFDLYDPLFPGWKMLDHAALKAGRRPIER